MDPTVQHESGAPVSQPRSASRKSSFDDEFHSDGGNSKIRDGSSTKGIFSRGSTLQGSGRVAKPEAKGLTTIYKPPGRVIADLIFVHGLGGGPRITWTRHDDPNLFWPQAWLPHDTAFTDVRMHTFGYDLKLTRGSTLDVPYCSKLFLDEVVECSEITNSSKARIVLVGHGIGGSIVKKALILSKQLRGYEKLPALIQSIVFLATPHHGSSFEEVLEKMLLASSRVRPVVQDLRSCSMSLVALNEEFLSCSQDLQLFSFYETAPMGLGLTRSLVVPTDMAILGLDNERSMPLNVNHRDVCQFSSRDSSNYRAVRNALVQALTRPDKLSKRTTDVEALHQINESLDVSDAPEDDLLRVESQRHPGSCQWIADRPAYNSWQSEGKPEIYWLTARPGAGKSVCCSHILTELRQSSHECSFYFFTYGDKVKSSLGRLFRSLAWQMASSDNVIFESLAKICKKDSRIYQDDYRTVWRKLFWNGIFKLPIQKIHFWVIDALDECKMDVELVPYLLNAAKTGHVRLFLTSRTSFDSYGLSITSAPTVFTDIVPESTTKADIELYLEANKSHLPGRDRQHTANLLLEKSSGCFLWVNLALQDLRRASTRSGIDRILEETPADMDHLYNRILDTICSRAREPRLVSAIIEWTACAIRPLTLNELYNAICIDLEDDVDSNLARFIRNNCGELVLVDQGDRVRMVHLTARDFLFSPENTSTMLRFNRRASHRRLAQICLHYLSSSEMAPPKPKKFIVKQTTAARRGFAAYACNSFPEHLAHVPSDDDEFAKDLVRFLKSPNILSWIEWIARNSNLSRLILTGQALRQYLQRRVKNTIPFGNSIKDNATIEAWAADLSRLVTKFGSKLTVSPSCIHNLIPPFCPELSALRQQFGSSNRTIRVTGMSLPTWDDCSATITCPARASTVASGAEFFAIGMQNGYVIVYEEVLCQEVKSLLHGESVTNMLFGTKETLFVAAGVKHINVWNTATWELSWAFDLQSPLISLALTDEDRVLIATLRTNDVVSWDLTTGSAMPAISWRGQEHEDHPSQYRSPITTAISADCTLVATAYRGEDVTVFDIENECAYDVYGEDEGPLGVMTEKRRGVGFPWSMIFSQASDRKLLVVGYIDGIVNLFNLTEGTLQARAIANAHVLASSPDGLTLASGNSGGTILISEFDTLKVLYSIQAEEINIKQLVFSHDSHRLLNIQGKNCRIWDPPVLVRQQLEEEESDTVSVSTTVQDFKLEESAARHSITALAHDGDSTAFYGRDADNGSIYTYDVRLAKEQKELVRHTAQISIIILEFDVLSGILASVDSSGRILVHKLMRGPSGWSVVSRLLEYRTAGAVAVRQILLNAGATLILISTSDYDCLWSLEKESREIIKISWEERLRRKWSTHPLDSKKLVLIIEDRVHLYDWHSLDRLSSEVGILLECSAIVELAVRGMTACFEGKFFATSFTELHSPGNQSKLIIWDAKELVPDAIALAPIPHFQPLADHVQQLIGAYSRRVVFLHADGWVCSSDSDNFDEEYYDRHFFIPADWLSTLGGIRLEVLRNGTLLVVKNDVLITISRGLEFFEHDQSRGVSRRHSPTPSIASSITQMPGSGSEASEGHSRDAANEALSVRWKSRLEP